MPTTTSAVVPNPDNRGASDQRVENPSQYIPIATAGIAVAGAIGVAILTHRLSKRREAITRFSAAAKEFRAAFAEELAFIESRAETSIGLDQYLFNAYEAKHKVALATFEHFVPDTSRAAFKAAWQQYHSGRQHGGEPLDMFGMGATYREAMFVEYMGSPFRHPTMSAQELAAHRIRELLAFARNE